MRLSGKRNKLKLLTLSGRVIAMLFFLLIGFQGVKGQQTFSYTQYMNDLTPINPASTLEEGVGSFNMLARKQWAGIPGAPTTLFFDGNLPVKSTNGAI